MYLNQIPNIVLNANPFAVKKQEHINIIKNIPVNNLRFNVNKYKVLLIRF
jgi:hypothetical protein